MSERDQRLQFIPMPAEAASIGQAVVDQLKPLLDRAFDDVTALPGNPAERINNALSIVANVGCFAGLQLMARLMMTKSIDLTLAREVALKDIAHRIDAEVIALELRGRG